MSTDKTHVQRCTCVYRNTARGGTSRGRRAPGAKRTANDPRESYREDFSKIVFVRSFVFSFSKETREFRSLRIFRDPFCYLILFYFIRVFSTSYEGSYYLARVFGNNDIRSSKEEYINL